MNFINFIGNQSDSLLNLYTEDELQMLQNADGDNLTNDQIILLDRLYLKLVEGYMLEEKHNTLSTMLMETIVKSGFFERHPEIENPIKPKKKNYSYYFCFLIFFLIILLTFIYRM